MTLGFGIGSFFKDRHRAFIESDTGKDTGRWIDAEQYEAVTKLPGLGISASVNDHV
jgi:hypothetical protein